MAGGEANIRVGSAERDSALQSLATHLSADRLDIVEYEQRCAFVIAARTRAELRAVFEDLPAPHPRLDVELDQPEPEPPARKSALLDNSPARMSRPIVLTLAAFMIAAAVVVAAMTTTWWALLPALLIILVVFLTN